MEEEEGEGEGGRDVLPMEPDSPGEDKDFETAEDADQSKTKSAKKDSKKTNKSKGGESSLTNKQQHLFLLEFLVDTVTIDSCSVDDEILEGQTCLTLSFLNFQPMEICEKDFNPNRQSGLNKVRFNSGKSLMFAFNEKQCERPPPLMVEITVTKKLDSGKNPCKVDIGTIKICISELFSQIVEIAKFKPDKLPTSKSIKDSYMLIGPGRRTMGEVSVYIRLSCLGQNVVTEFQCGPDLKTSPVLFKNREGRKVYEFTGNEPQGEDEGVANRMKLGCGCLSPQMNQPPVYRGGQGDAGKSSQSVCGAYAKGNRVVLDVPDKTTRCQGGQNIDSYKVSNKSGDYKATKETMMLDTSRAKEGLTVSQMNTNPDENCFVLKVGDKGQIPDRGKMILEFRTPKQKIPPKIIPPYHEDIAVQTESQKKGAAKKKKRRSNLP